MYPAADGVLTRQPLTRSPAGPGSLAERLGLDMGLAFNLLRDHARARNLRLSALAQAFIDGSEPLSGLTASATQQQKPGAGQARQSPPG